MEVSARAVLAALVMAAATSSASADTITSQYGAPFCEVLASFRSLIAAMMARDEAAAAHLDDCVFLKPGVRVQVLRNLAELGPDARIVAVRVYGNGTSVDGFTLSSDVDDATPAGQ